MPRLGVLCIAALLAVGCSSVGSSGSRGSSRGVDAVGEVLALAQETRVGGSCVVEADAEGRVVDAVTEIDPGTLPAAVTAAADRELPGPVLGAWRGIGQGERFWQVDKRIEDRGATLVFDDAGKLIGKREELPRSNWPKSILDAAERAVAGKPMTVMFAYGPFARGDREYQVDKDVGGEQVRISIREDGRIGRVLRQIRMTLQVPR